MTALPPGSTIGIIGGGQLGRMLSMAAAQLGYRCHVFAPEDSGPAADVCGKWVQGDYGDSAAAAQLGLPTLAEVQVAVGDACATPLDVALAA